LLVGAGFLALIGIGFGWFGVSLLRSGVATLRVSRRREEYEPTTARVLHSEVTVRNDNNVPVIEYEYTVAGETYKSDSVYPGRVRTPDRPRTLDVVTDHPEGERVEAYYDPADPATAFLVDESAGSGVVATVAGLVLLGIGIGAFGGAAYVALSTTGVLGTLGVSLS
jgi:hypothetical protein